MADDPAPVPVPVPVPAEPHDPAPFVSFEAVMRVLHEKRPELRAIQAALPAPPVLVGAPGLLPVLTGVPWERATFVSHDLVITYVAILHVLEAAPGSADNLRAVVKRQLQKDQQAVYDQHAFDSPAFILGYLHAYEKAILKHLHLSKVGPTLAALKPDGDGRAPITYHILRMAPETVHRLQFGELFTPHVLPDRSEELDAFARELAALQEELGIDTLH
jgi:hypothetical protein